MTTVIFGVLVAMAASVASATAQAAAAQTATIKSASIVGKGEGIEHPLIRQLVADPSIVDGQQVVCGKKEISLEFDGDTDDKAAVKHWAGRVAHLITTCGIGKVDSKFGGEIRVSAANTVAYVIEKDDAGALSVAEYKVPPDSDSKSDDNVTGTQAATHDVVTTGPATFLGVDGDGKKLTLPSYEYLYVSTN